MKPSNPGTVGPLSLLIPEGHILKEVDKVLGLSGFRDEVFPFAIAEIVLPPGDPRAPGKYFGVGLLVSQAQSILWNQQRVLQANFFVTVPGRDVSVNFRGLLFT